jgi:hypothetical protein
MGKGLSKKEDYSFPNVVELFSCFPYPPQPITAIETVNKNSQGKG